MPLTNIFFKVLSNAISCLLGSVPTRRKSAVLLLKIIIENIFRKICSSHYPVHLDFNKSCQTTARRFIVKISLHYVFDNFHFFWSQTHGAFFWQKKECFPTRESIPHSPDEALARVRKFKA